MGFAEITRKDLLLLLRDRRALVVLLLLPMAFICILGLSTGRLLGWRNDNQLLKLGVVDLCHSRHSELIIARMQAIDGVKTVPIPSLADANQQLEDRSLSAAVIISEDFQAHVDELSPQQIFDVREARMKLSLDDVGIRVISRQTAAMIHSIVDQLVLFSTLQTILPDAAGRSAVPTQLQELLLNSQQDNGNAENANAGLGSTPEKSGTGVIHAGKLPDPSDQTDPENAESEQGNPVYQTLVPAYTVMFAFFLVPIMGRSFIAERELGTLKRLRIAPISTVDLVLGKTIPFLIISLAQSTALFLFGRMLFGMSWGSQPWLLIPIITSTSLAATGMGLLIATLVRTDSQVSAYANFLVITLAGISGCFMPRDWLPEVMQNISLGTPHAWSLIAYHEALTTAAPDVTAIAKACGILVLMAAGLAAVGCWKMQHSRD